MKLILHHLLKDIRAQRWLLLLWAFILLIQVVVDLMILRPDYELANFADKVRSSPLLGLISGMLWIFLIVQVIQSEPVTGSTSFWLTRPIPRRVYIPSKALFILLLLILPSLLLTPLNMIEMHADPALIWQNMKGGVIWQAVYAIVVLWLATFTRSLAQFFLVVGLLIPIFVIFYGLREMSFLHSISGTNASLNITRGFMFPFILLSGAAISLVLQHAVRKSSAGMKVGLIAAVLALLAGLFWPFPIGMRFALNFLPASKSFTQKSAHVDFAPGWQGNVSWQKAADMNAFVTAGTTSTVAGINEVTAKAPLLPITPQGKSMPIVEGVTAHFHQNGGNSLALPSRDALSNDVPFDLKAAIQADVPDITLNSGADITPPAVSLFRLDPDTATSLRGKSGTLTLDLYGHVNTFYRKAMIPLDGHAFAQLPGEIIHVRRQDGETQSIYGIEIPTGDNKPVLAVWDVAYNDRGFQLGPTTFYLLADPKNRTGVILHQSNKFRLPTSIISSRSGWRDFLPLSGQEPLDGKVLYIYEFSEGDFFNSTLKASDFVMNPP